MSTITHGYSFIFVNFELLIEKKLNAAKIVWRGEYRIKETMVSNNYNKSYSFAVQYCLETSLGSARRNLLRSLSKLVMLASLQGWEFALLLLRSCCSFKKSNRSESFLSLFTWRATGENAVFKQRVTGAIHSIWKSDWLFFIVIRFKFARFTMFFPYIFMSKTKEWFALSSLFSLF